MCVPCAGLLALRDTANSIVERLGEKSLLLQVKMSY